MVLYESAKNVHGRPTAMNGRSYDNIFTHFVRFSLLSLLSFVLLDAHAHNQPTN